MDLYNTPFLQREMYKTAERINIFTSTSARLFCALPIRESDKGKGCNGNGL